MNAEHPPNGHTSPADFALARTTATWLASARVCMPFNLLFAAFGWWGLAGAWRWPALLLLLYAGYLHVRLAVDRPLFEAFAAGWLPADFDAARRTLGESGGTPQRSMLSRSRGALSLWRQLLALTALQGCCLLAALAL